MDSSPLLHQPSTNKRLKSSLTGGWNCDGIVGPVWTTRRGCRRERADRMSLASGSFWTIPPFLLQDNSATGNPTERLTHRLARRRSGTATARQERLLDPSGVETLPVLVVASNNRQLSRLQALLTRAGYQVLPAASGAAALRMLEQSPVSLAIAQSVVDMRLEILIERLRLKIDQRQSEEVPIILLAERFDPDQIIGCFDAGADDCITGPHLEGRVLLARIQTMLRSIRGRSPRDVAVQQESVSIGNIVVDPIKFRVFIGDKPIDLTRIQFYLLYMMVRRPGWIFSHAQLRGTIARHGGNPDEKSVKSHISHLRRRLGPAAKVIETVRGMGYRLCEPQ
jgi:DNA-binding response OmpR family regulator